MSSRVGVDIGATAVRVVEISGDDSGFTQVSALGVVPLEQGAVAAGQIYDVTAVAAAVSQAFDTAKVSRKAAVIGLASPDSAVASRLLPPGLNGFEREGVLRNDVTPVTTRVRTDAAALASYVAGRHTSGEGQVLDDVIVAAANAQAVEALDEVCRRAKVNAVAIDLTAAALLRALVRGANDGAVHAVADIGASQITVAVRRGPHLRTVRTTAGGGDAVTRAIMSSTGDDWVTAERRKRLLRPTGSATQTAGGYGDDAEMMSFAARAADPATDAYTVAVEQIVDAIALSLDAARKSGDDPAALTLSGGSALLQGLPERLYARVNVPIVIGTPWAELVDNRANAAHLEQRDRLPALLLSLAPAIGLALWKEAAK